jgi:hypothetical protein
MMGTPPAPEINLSLETVVKYIMETPPAINLRLKAVQINISLKSTSYPKQYNQLQT